MNNCDECGNIIPPYYNFIYECTECDSKSAYVNTEDNNKHNAKHHSRTKRHIVDIFEVAPSYLPVDKIYVESIKPIQRIPGEKLYTATKKYRGDRI